MSSPKPFPLLRLPLVALRKVIRQLDAFEAIDIYNSCRKAKLLKSLVLKPDDILVCFGIRGHARIEVQFGEEDYRSFYMEEPQNNNYDRKKRIKKRLKKGITCELESREISKENSKRMIMYWSNKYRGIIEWTERLMELYQLPGVIFIFWDTFSPRFTWEWLLKEQPFQRVLMFEGPQTLSPDALDFLKRKDTNDDIHLQDVLSVPVKCQVELTLTATHFIADYTQWMKMDNIFNLNCEIIVVFRSSFFDSDLTSFVRHWLNGGNPRLQAFFVQANINNFSEHPMKILEGLECNYKVFSDPKTFKVRFDIFSPFQKLPVERGIDVHRSDGATLTIRREKDNEFWFFISPPDNEQSLVSSQRECIQIS